MDGLTSLAVLFGVIGVWRGHPQADSLVGLLITLVIVGIAFQAGKSVLTRMLDGVDPEVIDEIRHAAAHTTGVAEVRACWLGYQLPTEINVSVDSGPPHQPFPSVRRHLGRRSLYSSWWVLRRRRLLGDLDVSLDRDLAEPPFLGNCRSHVLGTI